MKVSFTQKEFDKLRPFQDRLAKEFGDTVYVGTNSVTILIEYSPCLAQMLRPFPTVIRYEYELKQLTCDDCKRKQMFIACPDETSYVCNDCLGRRKKKGQPKS